LPHPVINQLVIKVVCLKFFDPLKYYLNWELLKLTNVHISGQIKS